MITGDRALAEGKQGAFYYTLEEFHKYWDRIDIIAPKISRGSTSNLPEVEPLFGNVFVHSSSYPRIFQAKFIFRKGRKLHQQNKYDLMTVHEYPPFYNGIGAMILWHFFKIPYVLEVMHVPGLPKAANAKERLYKLIMWFFIAFDARKAKRVRVINQKQTPEFLIRAGVSKDKIIYIPAFYIDLDTFKPMDSEKKYDLVFAARLEKNKGIQLLLEAVSNIKIQIPDIKLLVIGSGPLKKELLDFIDQNDLKDNVFFSGWLATSLDVAGAYRSAKVFVNPSYNEGGPRVVLEAMACGVPVVTTRVGLMLDVIDDGRNGLFVDWTAEDIVNKTMKLLGDTELQNKFREAGFETVKQFERKAAIKNYAEKLQNIIS